MAEVHGGGGSMVGDEAGEESSGHINICLHPRNNCINFNYHYLRVASIDNI